MNEIQRLKELSGIINEAPKPIAKISQDEFMKWFETTKEIRSIFKTFKKETKVPIQIIQGREDLIFLKDILNYTKKKKKD